MASAIDPTLDGDLTTVGQTVRKSELETALETAKTEITALQGSGDADEKVKVSADDTTAGYLLGKALGGTALTTVEGSGGSDETLTFNLDDTAVTPASYTLASITVDQQGRLTSASTGSSGSGDVTGPASSTDNAVARFDSTTGKVLQNSGFVVDDTGYVTTGQWTATDVAVSHGGTGASTDSAARTNLGVAIGSDGQAYDADTAKLDVDQSWSGTQRGTPQTITQGTLIDLDTGNNFLWTPAAADELSFTNETTGQSGFIKLINPSAYVITKGSEVKASSTFLADVTTAGTYLVTYFSDGTNVYVSASAALA